MEWTEIIVSVPTEHNEEAAAIVTMTVPYGIYIEDYADMEETLPAIGWVDAIDEELLNKDRTSARIHIYLPGADSPREALTFIEARLTDCGIPYRLALETVEDSDWADNWKKYFKPKRFGRSVVIKPTWEPYETRRGDVVIELDPGSAFGTGGHETTALCLALVEDSVAPGCRVLDMGCGSGILSIAALCLGAGQATAVDIDAHAAETAAENAAVNGFGRDRFRSFSGDVLCDDALADAVGAGYDLLTANIVADVLIGLAAFFRNALRDGGTLLVSGIIEPRADEVAERLTEEGFTLCEHRTLNGWVALRLTKQ